MLVIYPDPRLRAPTTKVIHFNQNLTKLAQQMREVMHEHKGMGLAAPQVGDARKLLVVEFPGSETLHAIPFLALANPVITRRSALSITIEESCLSLPELALDISRPVAVTVQGYNLAGSPVTIKADNMLARILQHEIDHLNGKLIIDYRKD